MRLPLRLSAITLCVWLVSSAASAAEPVGGERAIQRDTAGLATRYLPAATSPVTVATLPLEMPVRWAQILRNYTDSPSLPSLLELRLRTLGDNQPPDPRRRMSSGDVRLRLPLSDTFDLSPGVRLDYSRHPVDDLWTGDPTPTLSIGMRF